MVFDFPWERPRPTIEEADFRPSTTVASQPSPSSDQPLQGVFGAKGSSSVEESEAVIANAHTGLDIGEDVNAIRRNKSKDTVVQITMEDGEEEEGRGMDKVERRKMANEKWKHRKTLMDIELQRLKHSQKNAERVRRHSGAFMHQVFEPPSRSPKQRGRTQTFSAGINSTRVRNALMDSQSRPPQKKSRSMSMSMQVERNELTGAWSGFRTLLNPHIEVTDEDEEEGEEEAGLGLPPKDVPFFEEKTALSVLDMSQIPMEEIAMVGGMHVGHWNTDGCQDSPF